MVWKIEFEPQARKEFSKLSTPAQLDISAYIEKLKELKDPRARGKPLKRDKAGLWRSRLDKYRIICTIKDDVLVILVLRLGKRDIIYD